MSTLDSWPSFQTSLLSPCQGAGVVVDQRTQGEQSFRFEAQSLEDSLSVVGPRLDSLTLHHMEEIHLGAIIVDLDRNVLL